MKIKVLLVFDEPSEKIADPLDVDISSELVLFLGKSFIQFSYLLNMGSMAHVTDVTGGAHCYVTRGEYRKRMN